MSVQSLVSIGLQVLLSALFLACSGTHRDAQDQVQRDQEQLDGSGALDGGNVVGREPDASEPGSDGGPVGQPVPGEGATYFSEFVDDSGWRQRLEMGGRISFGAPGGHDGNVVELMFAGDPALGPGDRAGPAFATEIILREDVHFGSYRASVRPASCSPAEEAVNGIFVYSHGDDANANGITDNTEIDIEILCGEPHMILMTTWTDYDGDSSFRAWRRAVDMRTGQYQEATSHDSYGLGQVLGTILEAVAPDFPVTGRFYEMGFDWHPERIRWFIVLDGKEVTLWDFRTVALIPQTPARFMLNLWHTPTHWFSGGAADHPAKDATMAADWFGYWPVD